MAGGMLEGPEYQRKLTFDTEDHEFARGFEAGVVYTRLAAASIHGHGVSATMHHSNAEMCLRMAEAFNFTVRSYELDQIWMSVEFHRAEARV